MSVVHPRNFTIYILCANPQMRTFKLVVACLSWLLGSEPALDKVAMPFEFLLARWLCSRSHPLQHQTGTGRNGQGRQGTGTRREGAAVAVSFQGEAWTVSDPRLAQNNAAVVRRTHSYAAPAAACMTEPSTPL